METPPITPIQKKMCRSREDKLLNELVFFEILTRLPVKSLLRFRSVSKLWYSTLNSPAFVKLHLTRSLGAYTHDFSLIILVYDFRSNQQLFLSAKDRDGPATYVLTLPRPDHTAYLCASRNINGLICLHHLNECRLHAQNEIEFLQNFVYICNPGTRKITRLPVNFQIPVLPVHISYHFGFIPSRNEYVVVNMRVFTKRDNDADIVTGCESEIFALSTGSWRKNEIQMPISVPLRQGSICVGGAIYWIIHKKSVLMVFDLAVEQFCTIPLPRASIDSDKNYFMVGRVPISRQPYLINSNGSLGVVYPEDVLEKNMIELWMLDYQNKVWVMETITFPSPWKKLACPLPSSTIYTGEILLAPHPAMSKRSSQGNVLLHFYDLQRRTFRRIKITLPACLPLNHVTMSSIFSYTQSMLATGINESSLL